MGGPDYFYIAIVVIVMVAAAWLKLLGKPINFERLERLATILVFGLFIVFIVAVTLLNLTE